MAGIRDSKTVGSTTYNYITQNGQVVRQSWTENGTAHVMDFIYDNNGKPYALVYDGTTYYYVLNLQGDVIGIVNGSGTTMAQYAYDAWGKAVLATGSLSGINPIRYRGYYYDTESGLYYLQSRYYDPVVKRFINADGYASTGLGLLGYNMFAYCKNNPVASSDPDGDRAISLADARLIHNEVARRVAKKVGGTSTPVYVRKTTESGAIKRGFLDVYDRNTNSYYEVKSSAAAKRSSTKRQMEKI